ncbi:MAG: PorT family protein [Chitinophagales bacterium]|nr:PorT family protein [Chitinophagales bacterium]
MKTIFFIAIWLMSATAVFAQFEIGLNGAVATTWLLNDNVSDQGPNLNPNFSVGWSSGVVGNFYFTKSIGVGAELNYSVVNQKYDGAIMEINYDAVNSLKYYELPLLFKLKTETGFYFEAGPQFDFLLAATEDFSMSPADPDLDYTGTDIKTGLSGMVTGAVFGFGGRFPLSNHVLLTAGLRFFAGLTDATEEESEAEYLQNMENGKLGIAAAFAHIDQQGNFHYEKTTLTSGGIQVGLLYSFGNLKD